MAADADRTVGFFNRDLETLAPSERDTRLNQELSAVIQHAYANAPAIRRKFDQAGIKPAEIRSMRDLEQVPITRKSELAALQQAEPPFGGFLGVPLDQIRRIYMSPGPIYEPEAVHSANDRWSQAFFAAGIRKGDIGQITFSYHLVPAAFWFEDALHRLGCIAAPGGVGNTDLQVRMMRDLKVRAYIGTPSFLNVVAAKARELGYDLRRDLRLAVGFVAGEMLSESLRAELEQTFGMIIRQGYGTADVGCMGYECYHKSGMHIPYNCIVEIVDPDSGRRLGPGEPGEIVTTVFDRAYPLVRFGTGDLSFLTEEPCPCGRTTSRLVKIMGRLDQVTKVKGMFIHPSGAAEVAAKFPEIAAYQVVVTRENHVDRMTFHIATVADITPDKALAERIAAAIPQSMRVRGEVCFVEREAIPENEPRIVDKRQWD
ncbi:MAG: phenylacetate--CoA ligase family protein [Thermodesulfobacteriota bacterium]